MKTFDILPLEDKVNIVLRHGIHLDTVQHSIYRADLYAVKQDFIEVLLFPKTCDFVHVRMVDEKGLDKYLNPINVSLSF